MLAHVGSTYALRCCRSNLEVFRRSERVDVKRIQRARQHRIVTDGGGELDHALCAEAREDRLESRFAHPMIMNHLTHEAHDRRLFERKTLRAFFLINGANRFHRYAGFLPVDDMRRPFMLAVELPRRDERGKLDDFMI